MSAFVLRESRSEDVGAVLELWREADATPGVTDNADGLRRAVVESQAHVLVADAGSQIVAPSELSRHVHSLLLAGEVPVVEHLRGLGRLPGAGFRFFAAPVKVKGMGTFPVRAFGLVEEPA